MSERESAEREVAARPSRTFHNGPAAAAVLAAGVGCAALGIYTFLAESSLAVASFMELSKAVGPLSGKTVFAVLTWLIAWGILHTIWRSRNVNFNAIFVLTLVLVGVGFLLTFPPVFLLFAPEE